MWLCRPSGRTMLRWLPSIQVQAVFFVQTHIDTHSIAHAVQMRHLHKEMTWYSTILSPVDLVSQQACQHRAVRLASMNSNVTCALQLELLLR